MTTKQLFQTGILAHDFGTVVQVLGLEKAVEWGERTAGWGDHMAGGNVYPLTGFPFQITYKEYKSNVRIQNSY